MSVAQRRIAPAEAPAQDAGAPHPGSEIRRALIATALGLAFGAVVALFSRREARD